MQIFDVLLLGGIAVWAFFSLRALRRGKVPCRGCGGDCSHCKSCTHCAPPASRLSEK
jgi:hypothetical protein